MDKCTWPHFNLKPYCFGTEMLQEFLFLISKKNNNSVNNCELLSVYLTILYEIF